MEDDIDFKQAMTGVRRLKKESIKPDKPISPSAQLIRSAIVNRSEYSCNDESGVKLATTAQLGKSNDHGASQLFFLRDGQQKSVLKTLKKGSKYVISESIDLHGLTKYKAQYAIDAALLRAMQHKNACLLIIHGKGLRSPDGPTLKTFCAEYLKSIKLVRAFCSAQPRDGGTGALYVLLETFA